MTYETRLTKVKKQKWLSLATFDSTIKHTYYIKNISYGAYIESYDYNKVQVAFKSQRVSYEKNITGKKADFSINRAREKYTKFVKQIEEGMGIIEKSFSPSQRKISLQNTRKAIRRLNPLSGDFPSM